MYMCVTCASEPSSRRATAMSTTNFLARSSISGPLPRLIHTSHCDDEDEEKGGRGAGRRMV